MKCQGFLSHDHRVHRFIKPESDLLPVASLCRNLETAQCWCFQANEGNGVKGRKKRTVCWFLLFFTPLIRPPLPANLFHTTLCKFGLGVFLSSTRSLTALRRFVHNYGMFLAEFQRNLTPEAWALMESNDAEALWMIPENVLPFSSRPINLEPRPCTTRWTLCGARPWPTTASLTKTWSEKRSGTHWSAALALASSSSRKPSDQLWNNHADVCRRLLNKTFVEVCCLTLTPERRTLQVHECCCRTVLHNGSITQQAFFYFYQIVNSDVEVGYIIDV